MLIRDPTFNKVLMIFMIISGVAFFILSSYVISIEKERNMWTILGFVLSIIFLITAIYANYRYFTENLQNTLDNSSLSKSGGVFNYGE